MGITNLDTCLGIELILLHENEYSCRIVKLNKKGAELYIENKKNIEGSIVSILEVIPKNYPIALTIMGKGILHKVVLSDDSEINKLFQQAYPTIDQKEFYNQVFQEKQFNLISIVRKSVLDPLVDKFLSAGLNILSVNLGASVVSHILPQLNTYGEDLKFDGHFFTIGVDKSMVNYQFHPQYQADFILKIEQEKIEQELLIAYASAFQLLLNDKIEIIQTNVESVNQRFEAFLINQKLKSSALFFLLSIFLLLLLSFVFFNYYNKENEKLAQEVGLNTANTDQIDLLNKDTEKQQKTILALSWNGGYNYGFLVNEIGASCPKQLELEAISAYLDEKSSQIPSIKIIGKTDNLSAINNWIFLLKEKKWVKSVKLLKYEADEEQDIYKFNLILTY